MEIVDSNVPHELLDRVRRGAPDRKLRLFACACVRQIWHLLDDPASRRSVEVAEMTADGLAGKAELAAAWEAAREVVSRLSRRSASRDNEWRYRIATAARDASRISASSAATNTTWSVLRALPQDDPDLSSRNGEHRPTAHLIRDIFGDVIRPVPRDPSWLAPSVVSLAQAANAERILPSGHLDPEILMVLADALEESGCLDQAVLGHLRGPGPHVRGCHIVDLLAGGAPPQSGTGHTTRKGAQPGGGEDPGGTRSTR